MADEHLTPTEQWRLLNSDGTAADLAGWAFHVAVCPECHDALLRNHPVEGPALLKAFLGKEENRQQTEQRLACWYDGSFHRAAQAIQPHLERAANELEVAPRLYRELKAHPRQRQKWIVANSSKFQSLGLVAYILEIQRDCWHTDAEEAEQLARLALLILRHLKASAYPRQCLADFQGRAHAYLGNALRLHGRLQAAEEAFTDAEHFLRLGTRHSGETAILYDLKSCLRRDQRSFEEALELNRRAAVLYEETLDHEEVAALRLCRANILAEAGHTQEAIDIFETLLDTLELQPFDLKLRFSALQSLSQLLTETGYPLEAQRHLPEIRELAATLQAPLIDVRVTWLEGQVHAGLGERVAAEAKLREAQQFFRERDMPYDVALVSLDLAILLLEHGENEAVRKLALEILPLFQSRDIHREATAALLLFTEAARRDAPSLELAREVKTYLERSRRNPELKFRDSTAP